MHVGQVSPHALVLLGGGADHCDLLLGGQVGRAEDGVGGRRLLVDDGLGRRGRDAVGEQVLVGQVRADGARVRVGQRQRRPVGPRGEGARVAHAQRRREGGLARGDVEEPVVGRGRRRWGRQRGRRGGGQRAAAEAEAEPHGGCVEDGCGRER